jgi:CPA2 family monovalent cation:H+ antiporter-2
VGLKVLPEAGRDLILAAAILSIMLNPLIFALMVGRQKDPAPAVEAPTKVGGDEPVTASQLSDHVIVVGYGRVGEPLCGWLSAAGEPVVVVDDRLDAIAIARAEGVDLIAGNGADGRIMAAAGVNRARRLFVAIPDGFEAGQIVEQARRANPRLEIVARAHSIPEKDHLSGRGADRIVMGEREIARAMFAPVPDPQLAT